ncbi:MAG TPA: glycosyltransferase family 39 protein [Chthoniobacterales bacterium]|jgi:4-amino-4-deoxy-L-arabinose transferase-like glycosyltransferase
MSVTNVHSHLRRSAPAILLCPGLCAGLLWFYTAHNSHPFFYHTDEPGKVRQVIDGTRNFHHPLLLITATDLISRTLGIERTDQHVVVVGRWISAISAALAMVGVALLVTRRAGLLTGIAAGLLAGLHPVLFQSSHVMKEDCVLLLGIVAVFCGLDSFCTRPRSSALIMAGLACGVAVSGKYIGILILIAAAVVVGIQSRSESLAVVLKRLAILVASAAITFALINFQALLHPASAFTAAGSEFEHMRYIGTAHLFQTNYLPKLVRRAGIPMLIAIVIFVWMLIARGPRGILEWAMLSFSMAWVFALCFTPLSKDRYLIPVLTLFVALAVIGLRWFLEWIGTRVARLPQLSILLVCCTGLAAIYVPKTLALQREFATDSRKQMIAWIRQNLPADAVIAHEWRIWPPSIAGGVDGEFVVPQRRIEAQRFASEFKSIENLRALGATHVVVLGKFYRDLLEGAEVVPVRADAEFYRLLDERAKPVWRIERGQNLYIHPGLSIYELR